jgi:putative acetyltransferase
MLIRRERPSDMDTIRKIHTAAFAKAAPPGRTPVEAGLVDALRESGDWLSPLSLVAEWPAGEVVGHVVCSRAHVGEEPALGLGPLGVRTDVQRQGVGHALMHAVLAAADALDETVAVLLGHTDYYPRFGFRPAAEYGITPPVPEWGPHFQARTLTAYRPSITGEFAYAAPFNAL